MKAEVTLDAVNQEIKKMNVIGLSLFFAERRNTETFKRNITRFLKVGVPFVAYFKWVQFVRNIARMIKIIGGTINTKLSILCNKKNLITPAKFCLLFKEDVPFVVLFEGYNF